MDFTRDRIIGQARLHHVLASLGKMYFDMDAGRWEEGERGGRYYYDEGEPGRFCIAWDDAAAVGLACSYESEFYEGYLEEDERNPLAQLGEMPKKLHGLANHAADSLDRLVSSGLWWVDGDCGMSRPMHTNWSDGLEMLAGFGMTPHDAMTGDKLTMPWWQWFDLTRHHCNVALSLVEAVEREGSATISTSDEEVLLESPRDFMPMDVQRVSTAAELLAQAGVDWDVPLEKIERLLDEQQGVKS